MLRRKVESPHLPPIGHTSSSTHHPEFLSVGNVECVVVEEGREQERRKSCKEKFVSGDVME